MNKTKTEGSSGVLVFYGTLLFQVVVATNMLGCVKESFEFSKPRILQNRILSSQIQLALLPLLHGNRTYILYKKLLLNESKREVMDASFSVSKYHINTVEIIKSFSIKMFVYIKVFLIDDSIILHTKWSHFRVLDIFRGLSKTIWFHWLQLSIFCVKKEGRNKISSD